MKFSIKDFLSKYYQIRSFLLPDPHYLCSDNEILSCMFEIFPGWEIILTTAT